MATTEYLLSAQKLKRLQQAAGNGSKALIISIVPDQSGGYQVTAKFGEVPVRQVPVAPLDPPAKDGFETLCPVPPGCDSNGNCLPTSDD